MIICGQFQVTSQQSLLFWANGKGLHGTRVLSTINAMKQTDGQVLVTYTVEWKEAI